MRTRVCTRLHTGRCGPPSITDPLFKSYIVVWVVADLAARCAAAERDETQVDEPVFFRVHQRATCLQALGMLRQAGHRRRHAAVSYVRYACHVCHAGRWCSTYECECAPQRFDAWNIQFFRVLNSTGPKAYEARVVHAGEREWRFHIL